MGWDRIANWPHVLRLLLRHSFLFGPERAYVGGTGHQRAKGLTGRFLAMSLVLLLVVPAAPWLPQALAEHGGTNEPRVTTKVAGEIADYFFSFSTGSKMLGGDAQISITFPATGGSFFGFDSRAAQLRGTPALGGAERHSETPTVTPSGDGRTLVLARTGGPANDPWRGIVDVLIFDVVNPLWSGHTASFTQSVTFLGDTTPTPATYEGITIFAAPLFSLGVDSASHVVGEASAHTVTFFTNKTFPPGAAVKTIFPLDDYSITGTPTVTSHEGFCGTPAVSVPDSRTAVLTQPAGACAPPTKIRFTLQGITNPKRSTPSGPFLVEMISPAPAPKAFATAKTGGLALEPTHGFLANVDADPADDKAGATSFHTIRFTSSQPWPNTGYLVVYLPPASEGKNAFRSAISGASIETGPPGCQGVFDSPVTLSNEAATVVTLRRNAAQGECAAGDFVIKVSDMINPGLPGTYGTASKSYTFAIQDGSGLDLQAAPGPASIEILPAVTAVATSWDGTLKALADEATLTFSFTLANDWPNDGTADIQFPAGFVIGPIDQASNDGGATACDAMLSATVTGQTVRLRRIPNGASQPSTCTAGTHAFKLKDTSADEGSTGITLPPRAGQTKPFIMSFYAGDGTLIERSPPTVPTSIVRPQLDAQLSKPDSFISLASRAAGATTTYTFQLGTLGAAGGPWKSTDVFAIGFPAEYDLSGIGSKVRVVGACTAASGLDLDIEEVVENTIVIQRQSGATNCEDPNTHTFSVSGVKNPLKIGATGVFYFATRNQAGVDQRAYGNGYGASPTIPIDAAELPGAKFKPATKTAGSNTFLTVEFTSPLTIPNDATFQFMFPAGFTVSNPQIQGAFSGCDGTLSPAASSQVVTVTRTGTPTACAPGAKSITFTGVKNPSTVGPTGIFAMTISGPTGLVASNQSIDPVRIDPVIGALSSPSVTIDPGWDYAAAKNVAYTLSFGSAGGVPANGKVRLGLPPELDLTDLLVGAQTLPTGCTLFTLKKTPTFVYLLKGGSGCPAGTYSFRFTGIDNPPIADTYGPFVAFIEDDAGVDREEMMPLQVKIHPAPLTGVTIAASDPKALATSTYQIKFSSVNPWPKDGQIFVRFPAGYDLTDAAPQPMSGCSSGFAAVELDDDGTGLLLVRDGAGLACSGPGEVILPIGKVVNSASTSPATFDIELRRADGGVLDAAYGVPGPLLKPSGSELPDLTVEVLDDRAGALTTLWANFTSQSQWPNNGKLAIRFPEGFGLTSVQLGSLTGCDGSFSRTVSTATRTVTISRGGTATACAGSLKSLRLTDIKNPTVAGDTGIFSVMIKDGAGGDLDANHVRTLEIVPGVLTVSSFTPGSTTASTVSDYIMTISPSNPWPSDGILRIAFPPGYVLSQVDAASIVIGGTTSSLAVETSVVNGIPVLALARQAGPTTFAAASVRVENVKNPPQTGPTPPFVISTATSNGDLIDSDGTKTLTVSPKGFVLDAPDVQVSDATAGEASTYTIRFTPRSPIPANGCFRVSFPQDYSIDPTATTATVSIGGSPLAVNMQPDQPGITLGRQPGGAVLEPAEVVIDLGNIVNPPYASTDLGPIDVLTLESLQSGVVDCQGADLDGAYGGKVTIEPTSFVGAISAISDNRVDADADYPFVLTGSPPWRPQDTLVVRAPEDFDLSGVLASVSTTDSSAGALAASADEEADTISISRDGSLPWNADSKAFRVFGLRNPKSSDVAYEFTLELLDDQGRLRARAIDVAVPDLLQIGGALSHLSAESESNVVGALTSYTLSFATISEWPADAGMRIRFPGGYNLGDIGPEVAVTPASVGILTASALDDKTVLLTRDGDALAGPLPVSIVLQGVRNPRFSGHHGPVFLSTLTGAAADLDVGIIEAPVINGGTVDVTITAGNRLSDALDTYTFTFETADAWPGGGLISITFPPTYNLGSVSARSLTGCSDSVQTPLSWSPPTLTLRRSGTSECAAPGTKILVLEDVRNPKWSGSPGPFGLQLKNSEGAIIAATEPTLGPEIQPFSGFLTQASIDPSDDESAVAGFGDASYNVGFKTTSGIPANGYLSIRFPTGFSVSGATLGASALGTCTTLSPATGATNEVLRKLDSNACPGGTTYSFSLTDIANPARAGVVGPIVIATQDPAGRDLESAQLEVELTPAPMVLQNPQRVAGSGVVGEVATYALPFVNKNDIPADGRLVVTVPEGFGLQDATVPLWQGCSIPIGGVQIQVDLLIISLAGDENDNPCGPGTLKTLRIANLRNPGRSGATEPWFLETQRADGTPIDRSEGGATGPAMLMRGGGLSGVTLTATDPLVGATTDLSVTFQTSTSWAAAGRFEIEPPEGFGWLNPTATHAGDEPCDGGLSPAIEGRRLILVRTQATNCPAETYAVRVSGLVNGPNSGTSAPFHVATQTPEGYDVDASSVPTLLLAPSMAVASITPGTPVAGSTTTYTIQFDSMVTWPKSGYLLVGFPSGTGISAADVSAATLCTGATADNAALASLPADFVAVELLGASCPAGVRSVTLGGIVNALSSGELPVRLSLTGPLADEQLPLLSGSEDSALTLAPAALTSPTLTVTPSSASHIAEYRFSYSSPVALPPGGQIRAKLPSVYGLQETITALNGAASTPAFTVAKSAGVVTASLAGSSAWAAGSREFLVSGVVNPATQGAAPNIVLEYLNADGLPFASATFTGPTLGPPGDLELPGKPGPLTSASTLKLAPAWSKGGTQKAAWTAATDDVAVAGYSFAIDADPDAQINSTTTSADVTFPSDGAHEFRLRAIDTSGNAGEITSYPVQIDSVPPVLGALSADQGVTACTTGSTATVSWPPATDALGGMHPTSPYRVAVGSVAGNAITATSSSVTLAKGINNISVTAQDKAGNTAVRYIDIKRDVDPPNATLTVPAFARTAFEIRWTGADDCSGIKEYRVEYRIGQNAVFTALYEGAQNKTIVAAPPEDSTIFFRIRATDNADRVGAIAGQVPLTTIFDQTLPIAPPNLAATPLAGGAIRLDWVEVADTGGSKLAGYHVYRADSQGAPFNRITDRPLTPTSYTDSGNGKENGRAYYYQVRAIDAAGNEGPASLSATASSDTRDIVAASLSAVNQLAEALELSTVAPLLKAVDADRDGLYDQLEDPSGSVEYDETTAVEDKQALLLRAAHKSMWALWVPSTNEVMPVEPTAGTVVDEVVEGDEAIVTVLVRKQAGWILINVTDPRPHQDVVRVVTGDGRAIPLERVFRGGEFIRVLDDPEVTYEIVYDATSGPLSIDEGSTIPTWAVWAFVGAAAFLLALGSIGYFVYRGRRRKGHVQADAAQAAPADAEPTSAPLEEEAPPPSQEVPQRPWAPPPEPQEAPESPAPEDPAPAEAAAGPANVTLGLGRSPMRRSQATSVRRRRRSATAKKQSASKRTASRRKTARKSR